MNSIIQACSVLEELEKVGSRLAKEEILKNNKDTFLPTVFKLSLDPFINYGMIKFDDGKVYRNDIPTEKELLDLKDVLVSRDATGHAARDLMRKTLLCKDDLVRKWLVRIYTKNLRNGVSDKTVNKIWPKLIFEFNVGLCETYEESDHDNQLPKGQWSIEPKYDGLRCVAFIDDKGDTKFLSRAGKDFYNTEHIQSQLKSTKIKNAVIDGEFYAKNWNLSNSILHSQEPHPDSARLIFYAFDMVTLDAWNSQKTPPYTERKNVAKALLKDLKNVKLVHYVIVKDYSQAFDAYQVLLKEGFEGAVMKEVNSSYPFKRSKSWLKWKPIKTFDLKIVDAEEGTGRNKGRLGAFHCDMKGTTVQVGSGYDDQQRVEFWKNKDKLIGKIIEVQCQDVTEDNSLRFPVFLRFRNDL